MKDYIKYDIADVEGVIAEQGSAGGIDLTDEQISEIAQSIYSDVVEEMDFENVVAKHAEAFLVDNGYFDEDDE
jgi:hypothetical protein